MLKEKTSDVSMTNTNQGSGTAAEAAVPMSHGLWNTWRKNLLLFCLTGVYVELCLHLCVFGSMDRYAGYPVLFGLLAHSARWQSQACQRFCDRSQGFYWWQHR